MTNRSKTARRAWSARMNDLAYQSICTPSTDAEAATQVYIDALLEHGAISISGNRDDPEKAYQELRRLAFKDAWRRTRTPRKLALPPWVWGC
jgi:hypothetical protein